MKVFIFISFCCYCVTAMSSSDVSGHRVLPYLTVGIESRESQLREGCVPVLRRRVAGKRSLIHADNELHNGIKCDLTMWNSKFTPAHTHTNREDTKLCHFTSSSRKIDSVTEMTGGSVTGTAVTSDALQCKIVFRAFCEFGGRMILSFSRRLDVVFSFPSLP